MDKPSTPTPAPAPQPMAPPLVQTESVPPQIVVPATGQEPQVIQVPAVQMQPRQSATVIEDPSTLGHRNGFVALRLGPGIAVQGPLEQSGATTGGWLNALLGMQTRWGLSAALASSIRYHSHEVFDFKDLSLGATFRYTALQDLSIHPWIECGADLGSTAVEPKSGDGWVHFRDGQLRVGLNAALGLELDVSERWSFEAGVRGDVFFAAKSWEQGSTNVGSILRTRPNVSPGADWLLSPFVGVTYYR